MKMDKSEDAKVNMNVNTGMLDDTGKEIRLGDIITYGAGNLVVQFGLIPDEEKLGWVVVAPNNIPVMHTDKTGDTRSTGQFFGGISKLSKNCYGQSPKIIGNIFKNKEV